MAVKNFLYKLTEKKVHHPFDKNLIEKFLDRNNEKNAKELLKQVASLYQEDHVFDDVFENKLFHFDNFAKELLIGYKDHIIHSAYVFLTGIYLIEKISFLGNILKESRDPFFKKWAIISIFHDAGYPSEIAAKLMHQSINNILDLPFTSSNKKLEQAKEETPISFSISQIEILFIIPSKFYEIFRKTNYSLLYTESPHFSQETLKDFNDIDVVHLIAKYMANNLYSKRLSPLKIREIIIDQFKTNLAKGFIDHGLLSSVIFFQHTVKNFIKIYDDKKDVEGGFDKYLEKNNLRAEDIFSNISEVITAIYLHSNYIRLPKELRQEKFSPKSESCLTLFLIMLIDELQFWGRKDLKSQEIPSIKIEKIEGGKKILCSISDGTEIYKEDVYDIAKIKENISEILNELQACIKKHLKSQQIPSIEIQKIEGKNRILFKVISQDLKNYKKNVDEIAEIKAKMSDIFDDQIIVVHCIKKQSIDEFYNDTDIVKKSIETEQTLQKIVEKYDWEKKYEFLKDISLVLDDIKDHIYTNKKGISREEIEKIFSTSKEIKDNKEKETIKSIFEEELIISLGTFQLTYKKRHSNSQEESLIVDDILWKSIKKIATLLIGLKNISKKHA